VVSALVFLERKQGGDVPCAVQFVDSVVEMFYLSVVYMSLLCLPARGLYAGS
jgi:hypothetical protein